MIVIHPVLPYCPVLKYNASTSLDWSSSSPTMWTICVGCRTDSVVFRPVRQSFSFQNHSKICFSVTYRSKRWFMHRNCQLSNTLLKQSLNSLIINGLANLAAYKKEGGREGWSTNRSLDWTACCVSKTQCDTMHRSCIVRAFTAFFPGQSWSHMFVNTFSLKDVWAYRMNATDWE